jgi:photosystem II stability/assembly factor-like uncharacterized protein
LRHLGVAALILGVALPAAALVPTTPAQQAGESGSIAEHAHLASRSLLLDIAAAGDRLVAVGERGHVLFSDDRGTTWTQASTVPTQALLTGVCFSSAREGVAVGHDEVILVTRDAGLTWARTHFAPHSQQPLLDVTCAEDGRVIAVGAYGVYFTSRDGGGSWKEGKLAAVPAAAFTVNGVGAKATVAGEKSAAAGVGTGDRPSAGGAAAAEKPAADELGRDFHLNKIVAASATRLYIAAEGGHLYRSDDAGDTWHELASPYGGSFFGVKPLGGDVVLAYGLRGNLFRSEDAGATWQKVETGTHAMLNDVVSMGTTRVTAAIGLSGVVLVSHDAGRSFVLMQQEDRKGLSAAMAVGSDELIVVGEGGARLINIGPAGAAAPRSPRRDARRKMRLGVPDLGATGAPLALSKMSM